MNLLDFAALEVLEPGPCNGRDWLRMLTLCAWVRGGIVEPAALGLEEP